MICGLEKIKTRRDIMKYVLMLIFGIVIGSLASRQHRDPLPDSLPKLSAEVSSSQTVASSSMYKQISGLNEVEYIYQSTFRNCLGPGCFNEVVKVDNGKTILRVGILALKLSGGESLLRVIRKVTGPDFANIDVVYDNHVPPYGYGKNHGWSSIVRISRRVVQHSYALVNPTTRELSDQVLPLKLMDIQTRQIVRWHCRLSHVAAHTRMLTVFIDDLLSQPVVELEKIVSFMGYRVDRPAIVAETLTFISELRRELGSNVPTSESSSVSHLASLSEHGSLAVDDQQLLETIPVMWVNSAAEALKNELSISKTLTKWPCKSFREIDNPRLAMSAANVAANCTAPYVKCSVQYDFNGG